MDADGRQRRRLTSGSDSDPAWSPDGTKIVFSRGLADGHSRLFLVDVESRRVTQLTDSDTYQDQDPDWSPDGERIAFMRNADGFPSIYVINADGANLRRLTRTGLSADTAPTWSPDAELIAFLRDEDQEGNYNLCIMDANGTDPHLLVEGGYDFSTVLPPAPVWSTDGQNIAFFRNRTLYAIRPDGSGERILLELARPEELPHAVLMEIDWIGPGP
jgi:TolB protein